MVVKTFVIAPEYVSFYVAGRREVTPPIDFDYGRIAATRDCITVPSLYANDGDTTVVVGPLSELNQTLAPDHNGLLDTPHRLLMLSDALTDIADIPVGSKRTRIHIWVNHPTEPDQVVIGWADG